MSGRVFDKYFLKNNLESFRYRIVHYILFIYLKGYGTALKEEPPAAARDTLPIVATKLESTAQCGTLPVPPITGPPKINKSWLIRGTAQYIGKMKEETVKKNGTHELGNYLPHWPRSDQFREGKVYLHLKLNLGKLYK